MILLIYHVYFQAKVMLRVTERFSKLCNLIHLVVLCLIPSEHTYFAQQRYIRETLLRALLATQNGGSLAKRSGQMFRRHDEIMYTQRCRPLS